MIEKMTGFKIGDQFFGSLQEAQAHELLKLLNEACSELVKPGDLAIVASKIVANADKVLDVLSTTAKSKVRLRKINGAKRTRKPKATAPAPIMDEEDVAASRTPGAMVEDED